MSLDDGLRVGVTNAPLADPLQLNTGTLGVDPGLETTVQAGAASNAVLTNLLFRNSSTGANQVRSLNGATESGRQNLPALTGSGWQVVANGDFNRDGQDDLLWRNRSTGENRIWQITGTAARSFDLFTVEDPNWQVIGLSDFNADNSIDILWHNSKDRQSAIWLMNGAQVQVGKYVGTASEWRVDGFGDFNGDRAVDLVWRNVNTGETSLWLVKDGQLSQGIGLGSVPLTWKIAGVADFNGDRNSDLFWQNDTTRETAFWFFQGTKFTQRSSAQSIDRSWKLLSTKDLNGDQTADLLWSNPTTGEVRAWLVQNGSVTSTSTLLTEPNASWEVVANLQSNEATEAGRLNSNTSLTTAENQAPVFTRLDRVDSNNSNDFYRFTLSQSGIFTASLTGLTGDADVKLIWDGNGNGSIDPYETVAYEWERGTRNESVRRFLNAGTYYVQVLSYNNQTANYTLNTNFTAATSDDQQFRIQLNFADTLGGLSSAARNAITQAAQFWESIITSRSAITRSNTLTINLVGENLTFSDGSADTGTLAISGPTFTVDSANNLVITRGGSTLNIRKFGEFNANPDYLRLVMIHEFVHVFGFGTAWEPVEFMLSNGTRFTAGKTWIDRSAVTYTANSYAGSAYGDLLGTFTPTAVPIEPRIFAHWDETRFDAELMTPFAESAGTPSPLSSLTLAALRDLGWNINMGVAEAYSLSMARLQAMTESSSDETPTPGRAAYQCACSRCLTGVRTELSPRLSEAVGVSV